MIALLSVFAAALPPASLVFGCNFSVLADDDALGADDATLPET